MYEIHTPSGRVVTPPPGNCWKNTEDVFASLVAENRIWFGKNGDGVPRRKTFLSESEGVTPWSWWGNDEVGHSQEAKKEVKDIFLDVEAVFDTPKPTRLIERILQIATDKNSIVLDSFAGSGTTAHAVLKLNAQDGGNRQFILVETMDYAETITAERVRRVMSGYGEGTKAVAGLGGAFDFYSVGEKLFDEFGHLNPKAEITEIRKYIAWQEGLSIAGLTTPDSSVSPYWLGINNTVPLYFCYAADQVMTLDFELLAKLKVAKGRSVIYADLCTLGEKFMAQSQITFKKIPRDIARL
ncbi:site-specific DNA-methyltransferase [Iodobacter ciconiae]|uniref:site-specific DNA-methyltransferase (adenine-specific) n=1 Tax=Iodobacter ciconiae TaxID=2496266 RepID=A0A3S8ZVJ3_9NEIS|nr:site-specific DNA-methyltransferase [Iodobacter ciconiae]AZN37489.1 site-specific DNA-methyltransferase [Iodobacter ciconiae]